MWLNGKMNVLALAMIIIMAAGMILFTNIMSADAADDTAKNIERKLSKVKRSISTSPSRAEKDWLEAQAMLSELEKSNPNHTKISTLQKSMEQLGKKLEKRLGRPIGGSAPEIKKKEPAKKQATASSDLPSSVTSRLSKINTALNSVEVALTKNQLQTAESKLKLAHKNMDEIEKRYSKKIPEGNQEMKTVSDRLANVTVKVTQAKASAGAAAEAEANIEKQKEAQSQEWIDRFASFVDYDSDSYLLMGSNFNSASEERQKRCRQAYDEANALMAEYQKTEFPYGKTQELLSMEPGLLGNLKLYNEGEAKAKQQEACKEWVVKLQSYIYSGAGSRKYLIASATASPAQIKEQEALFKEAQKAWADYQKAVFPLGKTPGLSQLEKEMQKRLAEMPEALRKSRAILAGDLEGELDRILAHLNEDTGWKNDISKTPNIAMKRDIDPLHKALERYSETVDGDDAKLTIIKEKIAQIDAKDKANRNIRADRTFMEPERYKGSDTEELRKKVNGIVEEKSFGVLRVTLRSEDWKEEDVLEWTDTTKTKARYRITKSMTAQAAAKGNDGKVYLHSVHLASDRKSDGSWGPLYGHIMWSDWMAEENVNN